MSGSYYSQIGGIMRSTKMRLRFNEDWLVLTLASLCLVVFGLSGCASYGVIENAPLDTAEGSESYSIRSFAEKWRAG